MSRTRIPFHLALMLSLVFLLAVPALAQYGASLQGTVADKTGAVISGAAITVTNQATGVSQSTVSTDSGFYRVAALIPGLYTVEVSSGLFKKSSNRDVQVDAESVRGLDVTLEPGGTSETVTVTETSVGVQTENANVTGAITEKEIQRLPQYGRDPYELLRYADGVFGDGARSGTGSSANFNNTSGPGASTNSIFSVENTAQISADGQRPSGNNYTIDGTSVNSLTWGGAAILTPNQESIEEVKVSANSYSAEDGRNSGAQIKAISKTGTNSFHGSGFFHYDEPGLNAYNGWGGYQTGGNPDGTCSNPTPPYCNQRVNSKNRQFGGSIGGPVFKDKLFFFFSYEGNRVHNTTFATQYVETPQFVQMMQTLRPGTVETAVIGAAGATPRIAQVLTPNCADFMSGWPSFTYSPQAAAGIQGANGSGCQIVSGGVDLGSPSSLAYGQYVPAWNVNPNCVPSCVSDTTGSGFDGVPDMQKVLLYSPSTLSGNQYNSRVDFYHGKNQFAGSFYITPYNYTQPGTSDSRPNQDINSRWRNKLLTLLWTRTISSTMLNEVRFNATRWANNEYSANSNALWGLPNIQWENMPLGTRLIAGMPQGDNSPGIFAENQFEFRDVFSRVQGRHALKAGFSLAFAQDNNDYMFGDERPTYTYHNIWSFVNGAPIYEGINANPLNGDPADPRKYFRQHDIAGFVQDDIKLRPNLTVNLGIRYEYFSPLAEKNGHLSNLFLNPVNDYVNGLANATVKIQSPLYPADKNNFGPRIGFAWSPAKLNNKSVIRGGFGVLYNRVTDTMTGISRVNPPFIFRYGSCCAASLTDLAENGWMTPPFDPNSKGNQIVVAQSATGLHSVTGYPGNPALAFDPTTGSPYGGGIEIWGAPQNFSTPYVYEYSLEFQHEMPHNFVGTIGYQGSSSHGILRIVNLNNIYSKLNAHYGPVYFPSTDATAAFNALNATLTHHFSHGFQVNAKYRWSKSMDTVTGEGAGSYTNQFYPINQSLGDRGPSDFDATHNFMVTGLWDVPFFGNKDSMAYKLLGGWHLDPTYQVHSGYPWSPVQGNQCPPVPNGSTICPALPRAYLGGAGQDYSNSTFQKPGGNFPKGGAAYFDLSKPGPPFVKRNSFRGPRFQTFDVSLGKQTRLTERLGLDFRANFFNLFNKLNLTGFGYNTNSTNITNPFFGMAGGALAGRVVEFQARVTF